MNRYAVAPRYSYNTSTESSRTRYVLMGWHIIDTQDGGAIMASYAIDDGANMRQAFAAARAMNRESISGN